MVNPSIGNFDFDLSTIFQNKTFKRLTASPGQDSFINDGSSVGNIVTVPALDGLFLEKTGSAAKVTKKKNIEQTNYFKVYPNPSNNLTTILCDDCANQSVTTTIYTIDGKKVFSKQVEYEKNIPINFSSYSEGMYIIKISNEKFSKSTIFVKN